MKISDDLRVERISQHIWRHVSYMELETFGRAPANGLVVTDGGEAVIVDTPWNDEQTALLMDWIASDLKAKVTVVIPTHYHRDCMGGLAEAHRRGADSLALEKTAVLAEAAGYEIPGNRFADRAEIRVGSLRLALAYLGGAHTPDNIVVWVPAEKTLFGGCAVRSARSERLGNVREAVFDEWPRTIQRMIDAYDDAEIIVPGHGAPGGKELLQRTLELVRERGS